ncbi:MAG: phosphopyruvate hydratase [bacterium]|nr:phosphopyruvate hydratase [bacterium]
MTIKEIKAYQILDSRGEPTLMVEMTSDTDKKADFSVPVGKSIGENEAKERRDQDVSYGGASVNNNINIIEKIVGPKFIGYPLNQQDDFDSLLSALDGTKDKSNLGANTILALSGAYLKLTAAEKNIDVWDEITQITLTKPAFPRIFANLINGGKHAPGLSIQETMIVPKEISPAAAISQLYDFRIELKRQLSELYGPSVNLVGDEGGFAPLGANHEAILEIFDSINKAMGSKFDIALDVAANSFYENGQYNFEDQIMSNRQLLDVYLNWDKKFNLLSIEDPFAEGDLPGLEAGARSNKRFMIVGDDTTVTSSAKIEDLAKKGLIGGVIIKPNQVGTMTEMFDAIKTARMSNLKIIVSHRSGETDDSFIADLAYAIGAFGIKIGAPVRGERTAKYNRLIKIERDYASNLPTAAATTASSLPPIQPTAPTPVSPAPNPVAMTGRIKPAFPQSNPAPTNPTSTPPPARPANF